jgi:hypothetical protein
MPGATRTSLTTTSSWPAGIANGMAAWIAQGLLEAGFDVDEPGCNAVVPPWKRADHRLHGMLHASLLSAVDPRKDEDGEGGIRTLERGQPPLRDFQSRPFNRSGTSPVMCASMCSQWAAASIRLRHWRWCRQPPRVRALARRRMGPPATRSAGPAGTPRGAAGAPAARPR